MSGRLRLARALAGATAFAYLGFTVVSALGSFHWLAELLTHFPVQAAVAGGVLAGACGLLRMRVVACAACALALLHLLPVIPYLVPRSTAEPGAAPRLRVLQLNVLTANRRHDAVERLVRETRPDLLALLEVNARWLDALSVLQARYPHRIAAPREDDFGIALFSRVPIDDLRLLPLHDARMRMIAGRLSLGVTSVTVALAHPVPPASAAWAALRSRQLEALARIVNRAGTRETLLLGDLNTTPFSPVHARLERSSGLRNGARGVGLFPTWPAGFAPLRIPIDHFLVSPGLRVTSLARGPDVGSDHLPVLAEIAPAAGADGIRVADRRGRP